MDLTTHLTDNQPDPLNDLFSPNGDCASKQIAFSYVFQFDHDIIRYDYEKDETMFLLHERIYQNDALVFAYDDKTNRMDNHLPELSSYNTEPFKGATSITPSSRPSRVSQSISKRLSLIQTYITLAPRELSDYYSQAAIYRGVEQW